MTWLSRLLCAGLLLSGLLLSGVLLPASPAQAQIRPQDLPPVDAVFVPSVSAPSRDRIEVQWKIADGYYLYRHRTSVEVSAGDFAAQPLQLPKGKAYHDEFFGDVETYRGSLNAVLPGKAGAGASQVTIKIKYQGCADAGVCYPPQTRSLSVSLPAADGADATRAFVPLGAAGGARAGGLLGAGKAGAVDAAPLPEQRAFAVEAIAYDGNQLLLRFTPAPGYYVYRDRTSLALDGADGITLAAPRWPAGKSYHDEHFGDVVVYFDQTEVPVPLLRRDARAARATLKVTFQGCQTGGICYPPMTRRFELAIPAGKVQPVDAMTAADAPPATKAGAAGPVAAGTSETATTPEATSTSSSDVTSMPERTRPPQDAVQRATQAPASLWMALLLALAGGVVLNLMPCVLPVLSLKALSLASADRPRARAVSYTAGVILSFVALGAVALALRAAGQALGWGFQLQQPWVIGLLVYVVFAVGLSLSGVFAVGYGLAGAGESLSRKSGLAGDFFTGVLAVVVASPCTAPFMGVALAFAFAATVPVALLVFLMLGLGLALPFLLIGFVPALSQRLPRPGVWMDSLKKALAFPMYLTAVWLLWVLGRQRGIDAVALVLVGLVLLTLAAWWLQHLRWQHKPVQRALALLVLAAAIVPLWMAHRVPSPTLAAAPVAGVVAYSPEKLAELRAQGKVVFVDITADWCVTCKANEKTVLNREAFRQSLAAVDGVFMQGDWTNVDASITTFLEQHDAVGVPLYVVYPRGGGEGEVLPTVLSQSMVADALQRAARR
ncbi:protein-disulfide reductase DsbD family protein [Pseudoxanthomonas indica]|uniref:Thiol:disulfide interchange protein DsbD n=1 Tax=Pseudoxanthomonas indica TaxID=428993 RepID=A0A1T5LC78_9GAMM|nr:protein-disulfide reductase DsbD [Pseudoxanthomonas indica]GGD33390.1 cytochrome c biogenesis protein [Pseudoxanthomonas indica]SKC73602.1 Thiol:disulfide interchange protein DsbD [Pseudoxanthomonas indica]